MAKKSIVIRERITAIIGAGLLLVLVAASYYYSIQVQLASLKYVPSESSPDFRATNVSLTDFDEKGTAVHRLSAGTMEHFSDERMRATDVRYYSLDPQKPQITTVSDRAWSNDSLETMELSGNVKTTRAATPEEPELMIRSDYFRVYLDEHRLETPNPVFMSRGEDTTQSEGGMKYDNVGRTVELQDRVVSVFHPRQQADEASPKAAAKP